MRKRLFHPSIYHKLLVELLQCAEQCHSSVQKKLALIDIVTCCKTLAFQMLEGTYTPNTMTRFAVSEPKIREIYAPAFEDRLAHFWLANQAIPLMEKAFIDDTHANRKGKGTLAAVNKVQTLMRKPDARYALTLDVQSFFNHIDQQRCLTQWFALLDKADYSLARKAIIRNISTKIILFDIHSRVYEESGSRALLEQIPQHKTLLSSPKGIGLPIGSITSQLFANYYLNGLDHYIKHHCRHKGYV